VKDTDPDRQWSSLSADHREWWPARRHQACRETSAGFPSDLLHLPCSQDQELPPGWPPMQQQAYHNKSTRDVHQMTSRQSPSRLSSTFPDSLSYV